MKTHNQIVYNKPQKTTELIFNKYLARHDLTSLVGLWNSIPKFMKNFIEQEIIMILPLDAFETKYFKDEIEKREFQKKIISLIEKKDKEFTQRLMNVDIRISSLVLNANREDFKAFYLQDMSQAMNNLVSSLTTLSLLHESITSFIENHKITIAFNDGQMLGALSDTLTESIDPFDTPLPFENFYVSFVDSKFIYQSFSQNNNINMLHTGLHFSRMSEEITLTYYVLYEKMAKNTIFPVIKSYKLKKGDILDFGELKKERRLDIKINSKEFLLNWALSIGIYLSTVDLANKKSIVVTTPQEKVQKTKRLPKKVQRDKSINDKDYTLSYVVKYTKSITLIENKSSSESQYPLTLVRGYWRWQRHGEGLKYKRLIHIKPFLKGNSEITRVGNKKYTI